MAKECNQPSQGDYGPIAVESTVEWATLSIGLLSPEELAKGVTEEERARLKKIIQLDNLKDGDAVMALAEGDEKLKASFVGLAEDVDRLQGDPDENKGRVMVALILIEEASKAADLAIQKAESDSQRNTVDWSSEGTVESARGADMEVEPVSRKTMTYKDGMGYLTKRSAPPAPESDNAVELVESEPAPASQEVLPKAVIFEALPPPGTSSQELINDYLTDEGMDMLKILLTRSDEDIRSQKILTELDKEYGKRGFMTLATCILNTREMRQLVAPFSSGRKSPVSPWMTTRTVASSNKPGNFSAGMVVGAVSLKARAVAPVPERRPSVIIKQARDTQSSAVTREKTKKPLSGLYGGALFGKRNKKRPTPQAEIND